MRSGGDMREKYLWMAIIFLTVLTLGQACYIYENRLNATEVPGNLSAQPDIDDIHRSLYVEKASAAQWEEFRRWRDRVQWQLDRGNALLEPDFDVYFNDRFFSDRLNPFTEMERIRRQMSDVFQGTEKSAFDAYWDKWFAQRMRMGQFKTETARTSRSVTLTVTIPGLTGAEADVSITKERIRIVFSVSSPSEEKNAEGIVKRESSQSYVKILPLPEDAVPGTGKVETAGQQVKIKFERRTGGN